jgi:hypothetical protein
LAVEADITDREQAKAAVQTVIGRFGRLASSSTTPVSCSWAQSTVPTSRNGSG